MILRDCPRCGAERIKPVRRPGSNIYVGVEYHCGSCGQEWMWKPTAPERQVLNEEFARLRAELRRRRRASAT